MIVGIVGSRGYAHLGRVTVFVHKLAAKYPDAIVVSGGARDVDEEAEAAAKACGLDVISYRPYEYVNMDHRSEFSIQTVTLGQRAEALVVEKHRRINPPYFKTYARACFFRNLWIVDDSEHLVPFWDGKSTGTRDTIEKANAARVPVHMQ